MLRFILPALLTILTLIGCSTEIRIKDEDIAVLKQKYSPDAINYFYETVYYQDITGVIDSLVKWERNIFIELDGDLWPGDSLIVQNVLNELNGLGLPVKLKLAGNKPDPNVLIYFGDIQNLMKDYNIKYDPQKKYNGIGYGLYKKYYKKFIIGISNYSREYENKDDSLKNLIRHYIVLQEITQSLGVIGDSWMYAGTVFAEGENWRRDLSDIDKEVVKLLYEKAIPVKYPRKQFEKDFADVLYHIDAHGKIVNYVKENNIPLNLLDSIRQKSFYRDTLYKFPRQVHLRIKGGLKTDDRNFWLKAVPLLNSVSSNLQFIYTAKEDKLYAESSPSIEIDYLSGYPYSISYSRYNLNLSIHRNRMMFPRFKDIKIDFSVNNNFPADDSRKNIAIFSALYEALGYGILDNAIDIDSEGNPYFQPGYREILALLYEPIFWSGMPVSELDEAIRILRENQEN